MIETDVRQAIPRDKARVLVAEDDPLFRCLLQGWLVKWGYGVDTVEDGDQAWAILQSRAVPGLAIFDWMMPGLSGVELCEKLRQNSEAPYEYIVLVTAKSRIEDVVAGLEAGADDYVLKPFRPEELRARVRVGQRILQLHQDLTLANELLRQQATHDGLTGLWNRSSIVKHLSAELNRGSRQGDPVGVLMIDVDHFKEINDRYGHLAGDAVLSEISRRILGGVRTYDLVGRYGGDEFLLVAPGCGATASVAAAERLRVLLCDQPVLVNELAIPVSATFGVAVSDPSAAQMPDEVIAQADSALYRAKTGGRNRVETTAAGGFQPTATALKAS